MRSLCFAKLRLARAETSSSEIFNSLESASQSTILEELLCRLTFDLMIDAYKERAERERENKEKRE